MGTPFELVYLSNRMQGYHVTIEVPATMRKPPASLQSVVVKLEIAGRTFTREYNEVKPNLVARFVWDRTDFLGRVVLQDAEYVAFITYNFPLTYYPSREAFSRSFGRISPTTSFQRPVRSPRTADGSETRLIGITDKQEGTISGRRDVRTLRLGGWSLDAHHFYDTRTSTLHLGNGKRHFFQAVKGQVRTLLGGNNRRSSACIDCGTKRPSENQLLRPVAVAVHPDGSVFTGDDSVIYRTPKNGTTEIAHVFENAPKSIYYLAVHPTWGDLLISRPDEYRLYRLSSNGTLSVLAGTGMACSERSFGDAMACGDGGLAVDAELIQPRGVAVLKDGDIYLADGPLIRHITPDERINTFGGILRPTPCAKPVYIERISITRAVLQAPTYLAASPNTGQLYFIDAGAGMIFRIDEQSRVRAVAGYSPLTTLAAVNTDEAMIGVSVVDAKRVRLQNPMGLAVDRLDSVYFAEAKGEINRLRRVDARGRLQTVAGKQSSYCGSARTCGDFRRIRSADEATFRKPSGIAVSRSHVVIAAQQDAAVVAVGKYSVLEGENMLNIPEPGTRLLHLFNTTGRHLETRDVVTGHTLLSFEYNSEGLLTGVYDSSGNLYQIGRDAETGYIASVSGQFGDRTDFIVNADGYLTAASNTRNQSVTLTYTNDAQGRATGLLSGMTDIHGRLHKYDYDAEGRLLTDTGPYGQITRLSRFKSGEEVGVEMIMPENIRKRISSSRLTTAKGTLTKIVDGSGAITKTETYEDGSWRTEFEDGSVSRVYLGDHPIWQTQVQVPVREVVRFPSGTTASTVVSLAAELDDEFDPLSVTSKTKTVTFNGEQLYQTKEDIVARTTTFRARGRVQHIAHADTEGRVVRLERPGYGLVDEYYTYGESGLLERTEMGDIYRDNTYDARGRLLSWRNSDNDTISYTYEGVNEAASELIYPSQRTVKFGYDRYERLIKMTMPSGAEVKFAHYDTPEDGSSRIELPGGRTRQVEYRKDGQISKVTYPSGAWVDSSYDAGGRLVRQISSDGQEMDTTFKGRTTLAESARRSGTGHPTVEMRMTYDGPMLTRADTQVENGQTVAAWFTLDSRLRVNTVNLNYAGSRIMYDYIYRSSTTGEITRMGEYLTHLRSDQGRLRMRKSNGFGVETLLDDHGRVTSRSLYRESYGSPIFVEEPVYEAKSKVVVGLSQTTLGTTKETDYTFDIDGQLTEVAVDGTKVASYSYDVNGNRVEWVVDGTTHTATYRNDDAVATLDGETYSVSEDGMLSERLGATYTYAKTGQLLRVELAGGKGSVSYQYDPLGRRVQRIGADGRATIYMYGDLSKPHLVTAVRLPSGKIWVYRYDPQNRLLSARDGYSGAEYLVVTDHVGTVLSVVHPRSNEALLTRTYDAFGYLLTQTGTFEMPIGFAGGIVDPDTGLVNFVFRDYDPLLGRFAARDPLLMQGGSPNMYAYVFNDPVNMRDPLGLFCISASAYALFGGESENILGSCDSCRGRI